MRRKRAISEEQKEIRRRSILRSAREMFAEMPYEKVKMVDIAANIGVTKGTLYLYFQTKEALFLTLYQEELAAVFHDLRHNLQKGGTSLDIDRFVGLFGEIVETYPFFIRLSGILHTVLEKNVDFKNVFQFKGMLRDQILEAGKLLEGRLDFLRPLEGALVFLRIHELIIGCRHVTDYGPVVSEVIGRPGFELFRIDFSTELLDNVTNMLHGIRIRKASGREDNL